MISAVEARKKFENHAKRNFVADEDLDRAADSFQVVAGDICEANAKLAEEIAKLKEENAKLARVAQLSKGNGKANGGKGGKKAKAGKKNTGANRKKKKKQQVQAMSQSDDTGYVARVD